MILLDIKYPILFKLCSFEQMYTYSRMNIPMWFIKSNISCPILPFLNQIYSMHVTIYFLWRCVKLIINKPQRQETIIMAVQYTTTFSNLILFGIILSLIFDKMF